MQVQKNDPSVVSNYFRPGTQLSVKTETGRQKAAKVAAVIFTALATVATGFLYLAFTAVAFKVHDNKLAKLSLAAVVPPFVPNTLFSGDNGFGGRSSTIESKQ